MRGEIEGAQEADFVAVALEDFSNLEGKHGAVRVPGECVWSFWLLLLDGGVVCGNNLGNCLERLLALVEATGTESVHLTVDDELGQV